jgi:hypothetical protein
MKIYLLLALIAYLPSAAYDCPAGQARGPGRGLAGSERSINPAKANSQALKLDLPSLEKPAQNAAKAGKWPEAIMAHLRASMAARQLGDLKKARADGELLWSAAFAAFKRP